jgi:hypothetical protein
VLWNRERGGAPPKKTQSRHQTGPPPLNHPCARPGTGRFLRLGPALCGVFPFPRRHRRDFRTPAEVFGGDLTGLHSLHGCCHNRFASGVYHARHGLEPFEFDAKRQASPGRRRTGSVGGGRHHRWRESALARLCPLVRGGVDGAHLGDRPLGPARRTVLCIDPARLTPHPSGIDPLAYSSAGIVTARHAAHVPRRQQSGGQQGCSRFRGQVHRRRIKKYHEFKLTFAANWPDDLFAKIGRHKSRGPPRTRRCLRR